MKISPSLFLCRRRAAFTLLEMIGVMAIMAIIAAVVLPNAVRAIDRAAVTAENQTLANLGDQVKAFLRAKGWAPGLNPGPLPPTWDQELGAFADISPTDILTNKRLIARSYIYEPIVAPATYPQRVLIISGMREILSGGVPVAQPLPVAANLNTMARFDQVWNTADRVIPAAGANSWAGWAPWRATGNGGDFLVVTRVNLSSIYNTDFKVLTIRLNNKTPNGAAAPPVPGVVVSYAIFYADGTTRVRTSIPTLPSPGAVVSLTLHPRDRIDLYRDTVSVSPDSSYVLTADSRLTYDFNGSTWVPQ